MRLEFVINWIGTDIKVEATSTTDYYGRLCHMSCVGYFSYEEVDTGAYLGSASRYYQ